MSSITARPASAAPAFLSAPARHVTRSIHVFWPGATAFFCLLSLGLAGRASAQTVSYEAENLTYTPNGATASVQTDVNSSGGKWVQLSANAAGQYINYSIPSVAAGTYQVQMEWKGNTSRGILQLSVDGTNLGSTLDQYSATQAYPTTTFGNVTFGTTGTHTIRLTATGKNASSSNYYLSADKFTLVSQTPQAAPPVFSPAGGTYSTSQTVTITSSTGGASIRYTTDGSTPSETAGTIYSSPVSISVTTTLKAIAYESGYSDSTVTSATYTISVPTVSAPAFSPAGGTYTSAQTVTITSSTGGASIRYTTDGSTPSETAGTIYSGPVSISATTTLKAIAYESGYADSTVTSATYTISTGGGGGTTQNYEAENLSYTGTGATASVQTDVNSSGGKWVQLASNAAGQYIDFTLPNVPAGTYQVQMEYKGNTTRGIVQLSVDGTNLGSPADEYSAAQVYPTVTFGTVTFTSTANHDLRLTTTGKNAASTNYYISADKFTLAAGGGGGGSGTPNGNPILPPKWAFGVLFGSYDDQPTILSDMSKLRNGYCGDLIWVDSSWLGSNYNGPGSDYIDFKFDPSQFTDPQTMINTLHTNNFHFGVWEWPWIDKSNSLYSTGASNHYFIQNSSGTVVNGGGWHGVTYTGQFDLSTTAAANWWKSLNAPLFTMGFDFLKMDTTVGIPTGGVLANGSSSTADWLGFYHKAAYEATTTANLAQGRGLILAHRDIDKGATATNNDQYPGLWTGDTTATFSNPGSQGGLSDKDMANGFACNTKTTAAYWCGDTGGYNGTSTDELYQRWLQYGCFTPLTEFFGAKGQKGSNSNVGRFPWCFSSTAAATFSYYTQLRYQLLPFRYSNAQACYHVTGGAVQYPVWWPTNKQVVNGQGTSEILVQPVTVAGATSASVTFPESSSTTWLDYTDYLNGANYGTTHKGGTTATIAAPVTEAPLFIKAGSIIPMIVNYDATSGNAIRQDYVDEANFQADKLTLDVYPSGATSYTFYEDDGISDLYITDNDFSTTQITSDITSGKEVVTIGAANGSFVGQFTSRTYYLKIELQTATPAGVSRDGTAIGSVASKSALVSASQGWYYDSAAKIVWVKFSTPTNASTSVSLQ